jgi:hypothetical protein
MTVLQLHRLGTEINLNPRASDAYGRHCCGTTVDHDVGGAQLDPAQKAATWKMILTPPCHVGFCGAAQPR